MKKRNKSKSPKRKIRFESLCARQLLAADVGLHVETESDAALPRVDLADVEFTKEDFAELHEFLNQPRVGNAFGGNQNLFYQVDSFFVSGSSQNSLKTFVLDESTEDGFRVVDEYVFNNDLGGIINIDGLFVAITSDVSFLPELSMQSNVNLLQLNEEGGFELLDQYARDSEPVHVARTENGVSIQWSNVALASDSDSFDDADVSVGESQQVAIDLINLQDPAAHGLSDRFTVATHDMTARGYLGSEEFVLEITDDADVLLQVGDQIQWIVRDNGQYSSTFFDRPDSLVNLAQAEVTADGLFRIEGEFQNETDETVYASVTYSSLGEKVSEVVLDVGNPRDELIRIDMHDALSSDVVENVSVSPAGIRFPSHSLLIRTFGNEQQESIDQVVDLPFSKTGFFPGFVVDEDHIIAVRTNVEAARGDDGKLQPPVAGEFWETHAYLLIRDSDGQFQVADTQMLRSADYRASAITEGNGNVVLTQGDTATLLSYDGSSLVQKEYRTQYDQHLGQVSTLGDIVVQSYQRSLFRLDEIIADEQIDSQHVRADVNGDGNVTPADVLMVINGLAVGTSVSGQGESNDAALMSLDVNNDSQLTPADILEVINELALMRSVDLSASGEFLDHSRGLDDDDDLFLRTGDRPEQLF